MQEEVIMDKQKLEVLVIKFQNLAAEASVQGRKLDRRKHAATIGIYNTEASTYQRCAKMLREVLQEEREQAQERAG